MKFTLLFFLLAAPYFAPLKLSSAQASLPKASGGIQFVDVTAKAGITWNLKTLAPGARYLIETMGGGGGFVDYNGDGLLDIYLVCYSQTPQPAGAGKLQDILYRNNGDGTFTDVTVSTGIANSMLGMGLTVGDYNNDGWSQQPPVGHKCGLSGLRQRWPSRSFCLQLSHLRRSEPSLHFLRRQAILFN